MKRIAAIDILRALTMLAMLWVNDFAGMSEIPRWMQHAAADEDMLGLSDLVFPAFIFCVGLSIPFAIGARYRKGDNALQVQGHIIGRTLALVVMGIFSMNMGGVEGGLSRQMFTLLAVAGYFLIWNVYPRRSDGRYPVCAKFLQAAGIVLLIGLVVYKDLHGMPFRHSWWGILGLIGWAYLPCALACLFLKGDFRKTMVFWMLTLLLCILNSSKAIPGEFSSRAVVLGFWPGGWTHPAICATGMFTSMLLIRYEGRPKAMLGIFIPLALSLFLLGIVSHRFWIISKIQATPPWMFFCTAISVALTFVLYILADVKGRSRWARVIEPAGTATLTCYIIPYVWYAVQQMLGLNWPSALTAGLPGLVKAMVFAFIIIGLTWLFGKIKLKLKI